VNDGAPLVIQAGAVAIGPRALLIEGPPGCGKTSLALALIERGAGLIGDDAVSLSPQGAKGYQRLIAAPPPHITGMIEVHGVGIARMPVADPAPVALILTLGVPVAERLPETPLSRRTLCGVAVPVLAFDPGTIAPVERALHALRMHGLFSSTL
jgi:hypothetical protein